MFVVSTLAAAALTAAVLAQDPRPATRPTPSAVEGPPAEHQDHKAHEHAAAPPSGTMPLLKGLGTWHHRITTASPEAQRYFDQGLRLTYGFNHAEARRAFRKAQQIDPNCAMCYWGEALVLGPNINAPMEAHAAAPAMAAVTRAKELAATALPHEQALIDALAQRYVADPAADRKALDSAYADAMMAVAKRYPNDTEI